jgi:hypothetical protein
MIEWHIVLRSYMDRRNYVQHAGRYDGREQGDDWLTFDHGTNLQMPYLTPHV